MSNAYETSFMFDMTNGKRLGFHNVEEARYAEVASCSEGMTMLAQINGGASAKIETPFMVLKIKGYNYPSLGVQDNITDFLYRTEPKGWNESKNSLSLVQEYWAIKPLTDERLGKV